MGFRTRLLLASLATLALGLGSLIAVGNVLLAHQVRRQTREVLRERAAAQLAALHVRHGRIEPRQAPNDAILDRQAWIVEDGRVLERPAAGSARLDRLAAGLAGRARVVVRDTRGDLALRAEPVLARGRVVGAVVVALSTASVERLQRLVLAGSLVAAALVLLAGWAAIRGALRGALAPVARMTAQAEAWGAHDLDSRFDLGPPRDDLTSLAATLDHLLARIAASRRHEQRFAAEVAHELRTPVAGMRAVAELALGPSAGAAEREAALRSIVLHTRRLTGTIDTLLAVARREIDPADGSVDVAGLAREVPGVEVVDAGELPRAEGDPAVVRRALAPLVDNARRHASSRVVLELVALGGDVQVIVRDDGPGVPVALGERVFEPGVSGGPVPGGAGLGLPLARRLARSCGGDVRMGDGPGGAFVLTLPAVPG